VASEPIPESCPSATQLIFSKGRWFAIIPEEAQVLPKDSFLPTFETSQMVAKARRKIRSKTVRSMLTWAHYRFELLLTQKAEITNTIVITGSEAYTSKTCTSCGHVHQALGGSKVFKCPSCGHTCHETGMVPWASCSGLCGIPPSLSIQMVLLSLRCPGISRIVSRNYISNQENYQLIWEAPCITARFARGGCHKTREPNFLILKT